MRFNRAVAGVIATILLMSLAGCGNDGPKNGSEPTPTEPTSEASEPSPTEPTTSAPVTDEDKAAEALLGYLEVRDNAYRTGRISKKLNKYATGREHFILQQFVTQLNVQAKARFRGDWVHEITKVRAQGPDLVMVTNCEDSTNVAIVRESDEKVMPWFSDESGKELPRRIEQSYRVKREGDLWKVESGASNPNSPKTC